MSEETESYLKDIADDLYMNHDACDVWSSHLHHYTTGFVQGYEYNTKTNKRYSTESVLNLILFIKNRTNGINLNMSENEILDKWIEFYTKKI